MTYSFEFFNTYIGTMYNFNNWYAIMLIKVY